MAFVPKRLISLARLIVVLDNQTSAIERYTLPGITPMKSIRIAAIAFSIAAAFSAHATGLNQHGISNAGNVQAPPPENQGPTYNTGNGQGQQQSSANTNIANANGGQGGNAKQGQKQAQKQRQSQQATQANAQSVTIEGNRQRQPVSTAYAAGLAATGPCLGSASGGIQAAAVGISLGGTKQDEGCNRRYNAQMLDAMGLNDAAVMLMCQDDAVREAMTATGRSCAKGGQKVSAPILAPVSYQPERIQRGDRG